MLVTLDSITTKITKGTTPTSVGCTFENSGVNFIKSESLGNSRNIDRSKFAFISEQTHEKLKRSQIEKNDILFSMAGMFLGKTGIVTDDLVPANTNQAVAIIRIDTEKANHEYVYYYLNQRSVVQAVNASSAQSAQPNINLKQIGQIEIDLPERKLQDKIVSILSAIDFKIEKNNQINENLEQQAMALYRQMFVENNNDARRESRADEYFDISIGKTPPRKEAQWFSMNPTDCIWVSISDMGRCGMYIADSSEYLTHESVDKFNIKVVPDNTVLLSFKLTVGRVAITDGAMVTNEAIAHFKTDKPEINEYLYCYLKDFNYQTMGSTSSIATAVNSKIIKAMPFVIPTDAELVSFHSATAPMFEMIKTRQRENTRLAELRDSLLPKLMSGEIDVSAVQL